MRLCDGEFAQRPLHPQGGIGDRHPPEVSVDAGSGVGEPLFSTDPSYLGPYAASTPEEDFAESFSAYVFGVEAPTPEVREKFDWLADQPGLAEFRARAEAAGQGPLQGSFEGCG